MPVDRRNADRLECQPLVPKVQLQALENEEFLAHSQPSHKTKPKNTHNLSASVASNRTGEKKH